MTKYIAGLGRSYCDRSLRSTIDTLGGKVERDPGNRTRYSRAGNGAPLKTSTFEVGSRPRDAVDPKTMDGPIAQDLLPLPRHGVFSVREPHGV